MILFTRPDLKIGPNPGLPLLVSQFYMTPSDCILYKRPYKVRKKTRPGGWTVTKIHVP